MRWRKGENKSDQTQFSTESGELKKKLAEEKEGEESRTQKIRSKVGRGRREA